MALGDAAIVHVLDRRVAALTNREVDAHEQLRAVGRPGDREELARIFTWVVRVADRVAGLDHTRPAAHARDRPDARVEPFLPADLKAVDRRLELERDRVAGWRDARPPHRPAHQLCSPALIQQHDRPLGALADHICQRVVGRANVKIKNIGRLEGDLAPRLPVALDAPDLPAIQQVDRRGQQIAGRWNGSRRGRGGGRRRAGRLRRTCGLIYSWSSCNRRRGRGGGRRWRRRRGRCRRTLAGSEEQRSTQQKDVAITPEQNG
jgi:hypothetical protein